MKWITCSLVFVILLVLNGCSSYRTYTMEILRPPIASPSTTNGRLLLINNIVSQPDGVGHYYVGLNKDRMDTSYTVPCKVDTFVDLLFGYITARVESEEVVKSVEKMSLTEKGIGKKRAQRLTFGWIVLTTCSDHKLEDFPLLPLGRL